MANIDLPAGLILNLGPKLIPIKSFPVAGLKLISIETSLNDVTGKIEVDMKFEASKAELHASNFKIDDSKFKAGEVAYLQFTGPNKIGAAEEFLILIEDQNDTQKNLKINAAFDVTIGKIGGGAGIP